MSYPTAIDTDLTLYVAANRLQTSLQSNLSNSSTSMSVLSTTGIVPGMLLTIDSEIVYVSNVSTTLTILRGFNGTSAVAHSAGSSVSAFIDAAHQKVLKDAIIAIENVIGVNGVNLNIGLISVRNYGAIGDGTADDTTAINNALVAAAGKTLFFPPGTYKTTGLHQITTNGTGILGSEATIDIAHVSNDLFYYTNELHDIKISDLTITSSVSRTSGWVFRGIGAWNANSFLDNSHIERVKVILQNNGFWIPQFQICWIKDCDLSTFIGTGGIGIKLGQTAGGFSNQGSDMYMTNNSIYGSMLPPYGYLGVNQLYYGLWIEDCDAVYWTTGAIGGTLAGNVHMQAGANYGLHNHWFTDLISDETRGDQGAGFLVTGLGLAGSIYINGGWFSGAGDSYIEPGHIYNGNDQAAGILLNASTLAFIDIDTYAGLNYGPAVEIHSSSCPGRLKLLANSNGRGGVALHNDTIYIDTAVNAPSMWINDVNDIGNAGGGVSLRTSATSNLLNVGINHFASGVAYGTPPQTGFIARQATAAIGGSVLTAGACATGTTTVVGAQVSMQVATVPNSYPGDGFIWTSYVSAPNTVITKVCSAAGGTPTATAYYLIVSN